MYHVLLWVLSLFLSVAVFITTFTGISETADKRLLKQNINLVGKEIVNHVYEEDGDIHIREKQFVQAVSEQIRNDGFIGSLFIYDSYATAVDVSGEEAIPVFFSDKREEEISTQINVLLRSILPSDGRHMGIRFQCNSEKDKDITFFSNLEEKPMIFLVLRGKKYYTVSGYSLKLAGS